MAASVYIPSHIRMIEGGGTVTYKGNPSRCIWWALVGVDTGVEGAAYGTISNEQHITDAGGYATAVYHAPTVDPGANKLDRIKVYESISV
jgi:hypothetical protein